MRWSAFARTAPKKSARHLLANKTVRFQFIEDNRDRFPVVRMCAVLDVTVSGYYAWRKRPESKRSRENRRLLVHIRAAHKASKEAYGSPRVHRELAKEGVNTRALNGLVHNRNTQLVGSDVY